MITDQRLVTAERKIEGVGILKNEFMIYYVINIGVESKQFIVPEISSPNEMIGDT
jgi:hypothetical protein